MIRHRFILGLAAILAVMTATPLLAADAPALYKSKCFGCHGEKGKGDTAMGKKFGVRSLGSAEVQGQKDAVLTGIITNGKNKMPPYAGKIPDPDIKALVALIRTFAN